ncbi:hypothetical protein Tco_0189700 [Tanacetum coccineum]
MESCDYSLAGWAYQVKLSVLVSIYKHWKEDTVLDLMGVKGYRIIEILGRKLSLRWNFQGSRVEPTVDPHTRENTGNEDEEQDEGPQ